MSVDLKVCKVRLTRLNIPAECCLVCGCDKIIDFVHKERWKWQKTRIAESFCQVFSLPAVPYEDKITRTCYCEKCYQKCCNIDSLYRKLKQFRERLFQEKCAIEELISKCYQTHSSPSLERDCCVPNHWDDVRRKIVDNINVINEVPSEEDDSENKVLSSWIESNVNSGSEKKETKCKEVSSESTTNSDPNNQSPKQFDLRTDSSTNFSLQASPAALSDSDIFSEMIEPSQLIDPENFNLDTIPDEYPMAEQYEPLEESDDEDDSDASMFDYERIEKLTSNTEKPSHQKTDNSVLDKESSVTIDFVTLIPCTVDGCQKKLKSKVLLHGHIKKYHEGIEKPYTCDQCGVAFTIHQDLEKHRTVHSNERPSLCQYCGKCFRHERYLKDHLKLHTGGHRHKCCVCEKEFISAARLRDHMHTHYVQKQEFICEICSAAFKSRVLLKYHQRNHDELPGQPLVCEFCPDSKKFANPRNLRTHMKRHNDSYSIRCPICNMGVENQARLKSHLIKHSDATAFFCKYCGKGFKHKESLVAHEKMHVTKSNNERPFTCSICDKRFLSKRYLDRHSDFHKPCDAKYTCQKCKQAFPSKHILSLHERKCQKNKKSAVRSNQVTHQPQIHVTNNPPVENLYEINLQQIPVMQEESLVQANLHQIPIHTLDTMIGQVVEAPMSQQVTLEAMVQQLNDQMNFDSMGQISLEPISLNQMNMDMTHVNLASVGQINLAPFHLGQLEVIEPMTTINLDAMSLPISIDTIPQEIDQVNLDSIGQPDVEADDESNYFEAVSIRSDSNEMGTSDVTDVEPPSCMFEAIDMGSIGIGPMEMEASPATTLMETLASYYADI